MCGIAGVVNRRAALPPPDLEVVGSMVGVLRHRGPDEFGIYRDADAGLGHARLSIIDLAMGQQPLSNESGTLWITFNGELFNFVELRAELETLGHRFRTRSDTEVVVHAYEQWGDGAFSRFNGQWALALWNSERRTLVLARDPHGIRPLFVAEHEGRLYFGSEVKAIFAASASIPRRLDPVGLSQVFTFWSTVAPRTVFAGIEQVEPGTIRTYSHEGVRCSSFWEPVYPRDGEGFSGPVEEAATAVRTALERATRLQMLRADVPVGCYLSGGLDSALIATLSLRATGSSFSTFSLRFDDPEYDESAYQRRLAAHLGTDHHERVVTREDIAEVFPDVILHTEQPVLRTAAAPLYLLSRLVRESGIKVVLTGEGADEVFAGYDVFREAKVRRFWAREPSSSWRPRLLSRLYPYLARSPVSQEAYARRFFGQHLDRADQPGFGHSLRWIGTSALKRLFTSDIREAVATDALIASFVSGLPDGCRSWTSLAQDQYIEMRTLLSGYLLSAQGDRVMMAHSVEGRFPFLDPDVVRLADSLPPSYKLRVLDEKHVLKRAARTLVPQFVLARRKQPYRAPDALSFSSPRARDWVDDVTTVEALSDAGVFEPEPARQLLQKCLERSEGGQFSNADNMGIVGVLSTQLLHRGLVRHRPGSDVPRWTTIVDRLEAAARLSDRTGIR